MRPKVVRFRLTEVDVGAQRVQRHAAFLLCLTARHLSAAETSADLNLHAAGAALHRAGHGLLHRAPEGHAALQLVGDAARDQVGVELRLADLDDVDAHAPAGHLLQLGAQLVDLLAAAADDDARLGGVDRHDDLVGVALQLDARDRRVGQPLEDQLADAQVLVQQLGVVLVGVPLALPGVEDAEPEADRVDFVSHN